MTDTKNANTQVKLHGFYDFKESLLDDKVESGAVAFNEKLNELAVKLGTDWFFVESDEAGYEGELFKVILSILNDPVLTNEQRNNKLAGVYVQFVTEGTGEGTEGTINGVSWADTKEIKTPTVPKEDYVKEVKDFGIF
jgi:hypothetical protein